MSRPKLLDLFCGAGGAAMGYHRAGFDVVGIDVVPQPRYPFTFIQAEVFGWLARHDQLGGRFDAIHASPVCKDHSRLRNATKRDSGTGWQLAEIRRLLQRNQDALPWVIENVPGAAMRPDYKLCGCHFGLPGLRRERWFETSWRGFHMAPPHNHVGETVTVSGHGAQGREYRAGIRHDQQRRREAMGIDWMNRDELAQAIPPAFTELVGADLLAQITERVA